MPKLEVWEAVQEQRSKICFLLYLQVPPLDETLFHGEKAFFNKEILSKDSFRLLLCSQKTKNANYWSRFKLTCYQEGL